MLSICTPQLNSDSENAAFNYLINSYLYIFTLQQDVSELQVTTVNGYCVMLVRFQMHYLQFLQ